MKESSTPPKSTSIISLLALLILSALLAAGLWLFLRSNSFASQTVLTTKTPDVVPAADAINPPK